jgi:hypothetical protein
LLVVAVSINLERILQCPSLPNRAGHTLILFALPLVVGLLLVVPRQPDAALGSEMLAIGGARRAGGDRVRPDQRVGPARRASALTCDPFAPLWHCPSGMVT